MNEAECERSVRRRLKKLGYLVHKDRAQQITSNHLGGYMIVNGRDNTIIDGSDYDCSLDDLEERTKELEADEQR